MKDIIEKVIAEGICAPSGENKQPWEFYIREDGFDVYNLPNRDVSLYNYAQQGSLMAHGALIENVVLSANANGYEAHIQLFPNHQNENHVARVTLTPSEIRRQPTHEYISRRTTNRKPYNGRPLTIAERQALLAVAAQEKSARAVLIEDKESKNALCQAAGASDRILFENKTMHGFLFSNINWSEAEDDSRKLGMYIKTLELPPPAQKAFRLFKHWPILNILNKIGFAKNIQKQNVKVFQTAPLVGGVLVNSASPQSYIDAGRMMQRMWLTATRLGLSFQPITGVLFLKHRIDGDGGVSFSDTHKTLITQSYATIARLLKAKDTERAVFLFRIGESDAPSARSQRLHAQYVSSPSVGSGPVEPQAPSDRREQLRQILADLRSLEGDSSFQNQYAVKENIIFFEHSKSIPAYVRWLFTRSKKLDGTQLIELSDFPFFRWDEQMHRKLVALQQKPFPGLIAPLVEKIVAEVTAGQCEMHIVNFGSGGMEVERQVMQTLKQRNYPHRVCFVGCDRSDAARRVARDNLASLKPALEIHEVTGTLSDASVRAIMDETKSQFVAILCANNIFELDKMFGSKQFDILFHSLFKHHLNRDEKNRIDIVATHAARTVLEYDGYKSFPHILPQTVTGWQFPPLLSGAVFSNLRYSTKEQLMAESTDITFYKNTGHYLKRST
ncbi:MAG: hypothetical protein COU35_01390 [Candidatus Magasanikbacteria bacterium CG10_big_fil_rev_8_21_14_0_10_47_10]|uniref:Uncharacterized protein n=1 Tax=Candidatus Magasanikbacteria bacterium CG10_big_fil_rev_8_21_14_0_10_47_10 TaxID=1974652 RepID=A0A2H0TR66_9BACT|nr:MAG: hypothetical protein COU35_01390 [Candidatus Magasanikbacteria bacterium CG10_big_fil_rev_8_21_14_0_10_47_10]